jgi:hypothetical protein
MPRLLLLKQIMRNVPIGRTSGGIAALALWIWKEAGYGVLPYADNLRRVIRAATLIILGIQTIFSSFFMSALGLKTQSRRPPAAPEGSG